MSADLLLMVDAATQMKPDVADAAAEMRKPGNRMRTRFCHLDARAGECVAATETHAQKKASLLPA